MVVAKPCEVVLLYWNRSGLVHQNCFGHNGHGNSSKFVNMFSISLASFVDKIKRHGNRTPRDRGHCHGLTAHFARGRQKKRHFSNATHAHAYAVQPTATPKKKICSTTTKKKKNDAGPNIFAVCIDRISGRTLDRVRISIGDGQTETVLLGENSKHQILFGHGRGRIRCPPYCRWIYGGQTRSRRVMASVDIWNGCSSLLWCANVLHPMARSRQPNWQQKMGARALVVLCVAHVGDDNRSLRFRKKIQEILVDNIVCVCPAARRHQRCGSVRISFLRRAQWRFHNLNIVAHFGYFSTELHPIVGKSIKQRFHATNTREQSTSENLFLVETTDVSSLIVAFF